MNQSDHEEIASIARRIWENEGKPANRAAAHWHQAEAEFMRKQKLSTTAAESDTLTAEHHV